MPSYNVVVFCSHLYRQHGVQTVEFHCTLDYIRTSLCAKDANVFVTTPNANSNRDGSTVPGLSLPLLACVFLRYLPWNLIPCNLLMNIAGVDSNVERHAHLYR